MTLCVLPYAGNIQNIMMTMPMAVRSEERRYRLPVFGANIGVEVG